MSGPRWPAAIVIAIAVQAAAALVWAGKASARIDELSSRLEAQGSVTERLARLEAQGEGMRASLSRIEDRLERRP